MDSELQGKLDPAKRRVLIYPGLKKLLCEAFGILEIDEKYFFIKDCLM